MTTRLPFQSQTHQYRHGPDSESYSFIGLSSCHDSYEASLAATSHSYHYTPPFILSPTRLDAPPPMPTSAPTSLPPLLLPSVSRGEDRPEVNLPPRERLEYGLLPTKDRESGVTQRDMFVMGITDSWDRDCFETLQELNRTAVRAEIEVLRRERLAYEQEIIQTLQDLARSEAYCRALEARVTVLETEVHRHEWQRQDADDLAVQHIMRTQALEAGARVDTLEDTGSSS
ncbi:hypothetical protein Tco_0425612 [Tanacetum coccineum]